MSQVDDCLAVINQAANGFVPQVGMVLGSGLGTFADQVNAVASIGFDDLPGFPQAGVA
jgi:purine nucleoside phosphorylase